jgi:hypothetical protein
MCIVDESLETANKVDMRLKFKLHILADELPLLNCHNFFASGTLNTRTTVPLSEAVASIVPSELRDKHAIGVLCAWITFKAERERVSNRRISPEMGAGGAWGVELDERVGVADGEG